jgi:hypothetical protein
MSGFNMRTRVPGWLVKGRVASLEISSKRTLFLLEFTNHPVCAAEERDHYYEAQPPLLENGGDRARFNRLLGEDGKVRYHPHSRKEGEHECH